MKITEEYKGKNFAVLGLGKSGISAIRYLKNKGANVLAWDDNESILSESCNSKFNLCDLAKIDFKNISSLVLSPGIPQNFPTPHPVVKRAKSAGCEVIGDIELFFRSQIQAKVIGITGTNGKSTTTALLSHVLKENSIKIQTGGNIGTPVLSLERIDSNGVYILEISSYQLDLSNTNNFDFAILLNIQPDHLDRHGSIENYSQIKSKIFNFNQREPFCVIGVDDSYTKKIYSDLDEKGKKIVPVSVKRKLQNGISIVNGMMIDSRFSENNIIDFNVFKNLRGPHNWQNAAAVYVISKEIGLSNSKIEKSFSTFMGLPHRLEIVYRDSSIEYINDSKATNLFATSHALKSFKSIYWILGGKSKGEKLDFLFPFLQEVQHAFTIGESGKVFAEELAGKINVSYEVSVEKALKSALQIISKNKIKNSVILFSPGCSSFDQFSNFEERGDRFKELVLSHLGKKYA